MKISNLKSRDSFFKKIISAIEQQKDGDGFTKQELAENFGYSNGLTVDKWCILKPEIRKHCVYIPCNDGKNRTAVFVSQKYKKYLLDNKKETKATEVY